MLTRIVSKEFFIKKKLISHHNSTIVHFKHFLVFNMFDQRNPIELCAGIPENKKYSNYDEINKQLFYVALAHGKCNK